MIELETQNTFYALNHLAIIEVSGDDAGTLLQGQLTCNINELTDNKASIAAFCNPKGRVISTLLVLKRGPSFLIILPSCLLDKVSKRLQMYILRSKVQLHDQNNNIRLTGLFYPESVTDPILATDDFAVSRTPFVAIKLPSQSLRYLLLITYESYTSEIESLVNRGFKPGTNENWRCQDIASGFPWFEAPQSEQYIPQMLNIDQLGGISFNKGCYTGQEIVARTHYLGKSKRQLYLAECDLTLPSDPELSVLDATTDEKRGDVLSKQSHDKKSLLLIVLQTVDEQAKNLILNNAERTALKLIPYQ